MLRILRPARELILEKADCDEETPERQQIRPKEYEPPACRSYAKSATIQPAAAKELDMPEPTTSATDAAPAAVEDHPVRERIKQLTSQVLQHGRVDPEAVREIASAVLGRTPGSTAVAGANARESFAEAVRQLDEALVKSASATHGALRQLVSRGQDFTDNDLKDALVS